MTYLTPSEYDTFGLDDTTPGSIVAAASALIDAHCNRPTLVTAEYTERLRISPANNVRLTYLPLTNDIEYLPPSTGDTTRPPAAEAPTPFLSARVRYAPARDCNDLTAAVAQAFSLVGSWTNLDPTSLDWDVNTGEISLPVNVLGLRYAEAEFTYHAGFAIIPDAVKHACALITRSALATPALNVRASNIERMHMEYFSDSLLSPDVRRLLASYVAHRVA